MKTAISIPDPVFQAAEELAQRVGVSRSQLYSRAIDEYINKHRSTGVTEALNALYAIENSDLDDEHHRLQIRSVDKDDW